MAQLRRPHIMREGLDGRPRERGVRPSAQALIEMVDQGDPAFMFIAAELQRIRCAGIEFDEAAISEAVRVGRERHARHLQHTEDRRPERFPGSIVYYIRRGTFVKIGTTTQPQKRFAALLPDEILAWEPGGRAEEARRHVQFRRLRANAVAEYFRREEELDVHIDSVRADHGAPDPTWPTLTTLTQRPGRALLPAIPIAANLAPLEEGCRQLGIRPGTAQVWIHRKKLRHVLLDEDGKRLYLLSDLKSLKEKGQKAA